jgi:hypothetical protein
MGIGRAIRKAPLLAKLRLNHPAAWNDSLAVAELDELSGRINGGRLSIVGNASSIFGQGLGAEIDMADVIIRMNRGEIRDPVDQGSRTDILCLACPMGAGELKDRFGSPAVIWTDERRSRMHVDLAGKQKLYFCPSLFWTWVQLRTREKKPSTGFIAVHLFSRLFDPAEIHLFGFDWMRTDSFYRDQIVSTRTDWGQGHLWDVERRLVADWLAHDPARRKLHG